jgi:hypothetical protein
VVQLVWIVPVRTNESPALFESVACRFLEGAADDEINRADVMVIPVT